MKHRNKNQKLYRIYSSKNRNVTDENSAKNNENSNIPEPNTDIGINNDNNSDKTKSNIQAQSDTVKKHEESKNFTAIESVPKKRYQFQINFHF